LEDLRIAHRDLTALPKTPSGLSNMYGKIPYRFPAAVRLEPVGPIQAALVAQRTWQDPEVLHEIRNIAAIDSTELHTWL
jgi:hypothetical protein